MRKKICITGPWIIKSFIVRASNDTFSILICFVINNFGWIPPGKTYWRDRLSTISLLFKVACFVTLLNIIFSIKWSDLNYIVKGGQLYWALPFSKASSIQPIWLMALFDAAAHHWIDRGQTHLQILGHDYKTFQCGDLIPHDQIPTDYPNDQIPESTIDYTFYDWQGNSHFYT